jgi:hypothetical protein
MAQLDTVTQQNAAASEDAASAAEGLSSQAKSLNTSIQDLIHLVRGRGETEGAAEKTNVVNLIKRPEGGVNKNTEEKSSPAGRTASF